MFMMGLDDENVIEEMRSMRESEIQSLVALIRGCLEICLLLLGGHGIPDLLTRAGRNQYCPKPTDDHGDYLFFDT